MRLATPYTAAQLARDSREHPERALVHYLKQPNADAGVCDADSPNAMPHMEGAMVRAVARALVDRELPAGVGRACIEGMLPGLSPVQRRVALEELADAYVDALEDETLPEANLAALHAPLLLTELSPSEVRALSALRDNLEALLAGQTLRVARRQRALAVLTGLDATAGRYRGRPVSEATLSGVPDADLVVLAVRLPDLRLRSAARAERVRRVASRSEHPLVRADIEGTVRRMLASGHNALPASAQVTRVWFALPGPYASIVVQQRSGLHARLLAQRRGSLSVVPALPLAGWLLLQVAGVESPLSVCGKPDDAVVTPCLSVGALHVLSPLLSLDDRGVLRMREEMPLRGALELLNGDPAFFTLQVQIGESLAETMLPLRFADAEPLVFAGSGLGSAGPNLHVSQRERSGHLIYDVRGVDPSDPSYLVVVGPQRPATAVVISEGSPGAQGHNGIPGAAGHMGSRGMAATCHSNGQNGGRGGNGHMGGPGGAGGSGGAGGDIYVVVHCEEADCGRLVGDARRLVESRGGPGGAGGAGGAGGPGGQGGMGGSGTSCRVQVPSFGSSSSSPTYRTEYKSGGSTGMPGSQGPMGPRGIPGPRGPAGDVQVVTSQ